MMLFNLKFQTSTPTSIKFTTVQNHKVWILMLLNKLLQHAKMPKKKKQSKTHILILKGISITLRTYFDTFVLYKIFNWKLWHLFAINNPVHFRFNLFFSNKFPLEYSVKCSVQHWYILLSVKTSRFSIC